MNPYPWSTKHRRQGTRLIMEMIQGKIGTPVGIIGAVLSLGVSWIVSVALRRQYDRINNSWWKRGLGMITVGALLMLTVGSPTGIPDAFMGVLRSFGTNPEVELQTALLNLLRVTMPLGITLGGISNLIDCYWFEIRGERYIYETLPTVVTKRRYKSNVDVLRTSKNVGDGWLRFGPINDDIIPWRTPRYGMMCERPMRKLGHGVVLGANGTGKTVLALSLAYQAAASKSGVLYIDFKASLATYRAMKHAAHLAGVPFYSFDVGIQTGDVSWYDPLGWEGTPNQKMSMLVSSFNFSETGDASFYRDQAQEWLTLQFEVMDRVGRKPGEGQFDFLLGTSTPAALQERIETLRGGSDADRTLHKRWSDQISLMKSDRLSSLRSNLRSVVNSGGHRLRPNGDAAPISLKNVADNGGICYIGLSPGTDEVALKIIGSLVLRDLSVLSDARSHMGEGDGRRDVLAIVDEASRMGHRATVMEDLFTLAREADVHLWTFSQSLTSWPANTRSEMMNNAMTVVAFRVQDTETGVVLSNKFGSINVLNERVEEKIEHNLGRGETTSTEGEAAKYLDKDLHASPGFFGSPRRIPNRHALVMFSGSQDRPTRKVWKSRRVRRDEVDHDLPLVEIVASEELLNPPAPQIEGRSFDELMNDAGYGKEFTYDDPTLLGEYELDEGNADGECDGDAWEDDTPTRTENTNANANNAQQPPSPRRTTARQENLWD